MDRQLYRAVLPGQQPDINYKARLQGTRAAVEPIVLHYLEMLEKQLDKYFNAPINPDFANKIMSIKLSGLQLTDLEFKILQDSATSYMERRLLNQLAESRTKTERKAVINKDLVKPSTKRNKHWIHTSIWNYLIQKIHTMQ